MDTDGEQGADGREPSFEEQLARRIHQAIIVVPPRRRLRSLLVTALVLATVALGVLVATNGGAHF